MQVDQVEALLAEHLRGHAEMLRGERTMFGSEPFAGTTTDRPTGMIPAREVAVAARCADGEAAWRGPAGRDP